MGCGFAEEQPTGPSTFAGCNSCTPAFNKHLSKQVEYTISMSIVNSNLVNQGASNKGEVLSPKQLHNDDLRRKLTEG
jgi:hypothetical protein